MTAPFEPYYLGAMDLGSNSLRLAIFRVDAAGGFEEVENVKRTLRLGGRLDAAGCLGPDAITELVGCVRHFKRVAAAWQARELLAVATAVFRQAANGDEVLAACSAELGIPVRLLSGEEEAALGLAGVVNTMGYPDALVVDLGGASVELTSLRHHCVVNSISVPLGALTLTERFLSGGANVGGLFSLRATLRAVFDSHPWVATAEGPLICIGGTARSIARVHQGRRLAQLLGEHHYVLAAAELEALTAQITAMGPEARVELPGLSGDRAELIDAGLAVFTALSAGRRDMVVCGAGLREGQLFDRLAATRGPVIPSEMAVRGALRLAGGLGLDLAHARHCRHLALGLYDSLEVLALPRARLLLEVAALLRGIGRRISFQRFEGHTFAALLRTPLAGLTATERAITAVVASFRTARQLKQQLEQLKPLLANVSDRDLERLGALLLLAEGLDRTRLQAVTSARLGTKGGALEVICHAASTDLVEYAMLDEPLDRLQKAFKRPAVVTALGEEREA